MNQQVGEQMHDGLRWLPGSFPEGFSVTFCEGLSGLDLLQRLGANPECALSLRRDQAEIIDIYNRSPESVDLDSFDLDEDELNDKGFLERGIEVVRAGENGRWAFTIQSFGAYSATTRRAKSVSQGTRFISFNRTVNTASWVQYALNGHLIQSFDPLHPQMNTPGGVPFPGLVKAEDPGMRVLQVLEESLGLSIPRSSNQTGLLSVPLGRA
ncbi:DUF6461 domain-containing protein [Streptomyces sp. NBC_00452]|uniref:DUF6461 domain-containing protein n=1 Tax=Streptomyces sp. NBC_00452 TaxID=2975746 RepID=UPI0022560F2E|nr:DUF6461 domain-containing protein [Streptomyces sp. NBC_00452]MCX5057129.1 DUF6461 domain-containing protein [Streptomyces sp. NBC_00452]